MLPAQASLALEELGWNSFQDLAVSLCEDLLGAPINTFSPTNDRGVDGILDPIKGSKQLSSSVLQVKHTSTFSTLTAKAFAPEIAKLNALTVDFPISRYVLVTNARLSFPQSRLIKAAAVGAGAAEALIVSRDNIVRRVRKSPTLRGMVPRLYGIGDLSQILDERRLAQAQALLASAQTDLDKFVVTESYRKSLHALRSVRLLVLLGDPAVGKSTIARCLSMASVDEFDAFPIILETISKLPDHWNPNDKRRLFWVDDTFGVTQRDDAEIQAFNKLIPTISTAMRSGCRFIFTSRSYIWNLSKPLLKLSSFPDYEDARVEIDVRRFTEFERAQIVYNHVKLGDQTAAWKAQFKNLLPSVARHRDFKPEVARRLGLKAFTKGLDPTQGLIDRFVTNPAEFLEETIAGLDNSSRAALAGVLMSGGALRSPLAQTEALDAVCALFGVSYSDIAQRLTAMEGAFFRYTSEDDEHLWRFSHPTIGEAMASVAVKDAELLDVYLSGAPAQRLLTEVACVGREVKGAIIKVGASRYTTLIEKIKSKDVSNYSVLTFLAYRATPSFRKMFFTTPLEPGDPLLGSWSLTNRFLLDLFYALWADGLLSPTMKAAVQSAISRGIMYEGDSDCLLPAARELLGAEQFGHAVESAWSILQDDPGSILEYWENSLDDDADPEDHLFGLTSFVGKLYECFESDDDLDVIQDRLYDYISERSEEIKSERKRSSESEEDDGSWRDWREYGPSARRSAPSSAAVTKDRLSALFSDVDEG